MKGKHIGMDKAILVYNPFSGDHSLHQKLDYIIERIQNEGVLLRPYRIQYDRGDILLNILKKNNYKFIISSGGDGTLNFVSNIILKGGIDIPMGIIPAGTCNDFASILKIPSNLDGCLDVVLGGKTIAVDAGLINEETYFLSSCAGGAFVGVSFNTHSELKKNFGPFAYYLKSLSEVASIKSYKLMVQIEEETIEDDIVLFVILNGKQAGGFNNIVTEADISDGLMDIVLIKSCSHIDLAGVFFSVLSNETLNNKNIVNLRAKSCIIKGSSDVSLSIDGEKGTGLPINVRFIHSALKVFVK